MQTVTATARQFKFALAVAFLISGVPLAQAETRPLDGGASPDRRYHVQVTRTGTTPEITYDLIRSHDGALLHRFRSSYHPEEGELPNWSWNHSVGADVAWSPNSQHISIDENVHRYIGTVLVATLTKIGFRAIKIPERAIVAATEQRWDRYRIHHQRGWISSDKLSLIIIGKEANTAKEICYEIILRVRAGKNSIVSCHKITDPDWTRDNGL